MGHILSFQHFQTAPNHYSTVLSMKLPDLCTFYAVFHEFHVENRCFDQLKHYSNQCSKYTVYEIVESVENRPFTHVSMWKTQPLACYLAPSYMEPFAIDM